MPPQPSEMEEQITPSAWQLVGTQPGVTHWFWTHAWPAVQPQSMVPPQPSGNVPQLPSAGHARAVQAGAVGGVPTHAPRSNSMYSSTFS
jgi:hypothetical protein